MNQDEDRDSFGDLNFFEKILVIALLSLLAVLAISFVVGVTFFGIAGFFNLFSVYYESYLSLFLFVVVSFVVGIFVDLFFTDWIIILVSLILSGKRQRFLARLLINSLFTVLALFITDELMTGVTVSPIMEMATALFLSLTDAAFGHKRRKPS